jgi:hypothetical protein
MHVPALVTSVLAIGIAGCQTGTKPPSSVHDPLEPRPIRTVSVSVAVEEVAAGVQDRREDPPAAAFTPALSGSERVPLWVSESILSHDEHLVLDSARAMQGDAPDEGLDLDDLRKFPFNRFPLELGGRPVTVKWNVSKGLGITAKIRM